MPACSIANCKNYHHKENKTKIIFHRFPKNKTLRNQWISKCFRKDRFNPSNARICSQHFLDSDYIQNSKRAKLSSSAIPSVNLPASFQNDKQKIICNLNNESTPTVSVGSEERNLSLPVVMPISVNTSNLSISSNSKKALNSNLNNFENFQSASNSSEQCTTSVLSDHSNSNESSIICKNPSHSEIEKQLSEMKNKMEFLQKQNDIFKEEKFLPEFFSKPF